MFNETSENKRNLKVLARFNECDKFSHAERKHDLRLGSRVRGLPSVNYDTTTYRLSHKITIKTEKYFASFYFYIILAMRFINYKLKMLI